MLPWEALTPAAGSIAPASGSGQALCSRDGTSWGKMSLVWPVGRGRFSFPSTLPW